MRYLMTRIVSLYLSEGPEYDYKSSDEDGDEVTEEEGEPRYTVNESTYHCSSLTPLTFKANAARVCVQYGQIHSVAVLAVLG